MTDTTERGLILQDLVLAASNLFIFLLLDGTLSATGQWWIAAVIALVSGGLFAAADRSRVGLWAVFVVGVAAIGGIVWMTTLDAHPVGAFTRLFLGLALGLGGNRFVFGVVRPVPDYRRRRQAGAE